MLPFFDVTNFLTQVPPELVQGSSYVKPVVLILLSYFNHVVFT